MLTNDIVSFEQLDPDLHFVERIDSQIVDLYFIVPDETLFFSQKILIFFLFLHENICSGFHLKHMSCF